jgi:hypothetical protein
MTTSNWCPADGPTVAGNMSRKTQKLKAFLAAPTESTLSALISKKVRAW